MKLLAALAREVPGTWSVEEVTLEGPVGGEVLVEMKAAGLCHSDENIMDGKHRLPMLPFTGGHEGAGVVVEVGPAVKSLKPGDHVVSTFLPSCGRCRWCASGMQNLCDKGASFGMLARSDGTFRMMSSDTKPVAQAMGTFAEWMVLPEECFVAVPHYVPFGVACLLGCGVPTGYGSATAAAEVKTGDVVIVLGVGGVGVNAVQGASAAGAAQVIAVDLKEFKRKTALEFGASSAFETMAEATELARSLTNGQGADSVIICTDAVHGEYVADAFAAIRKAGTVVVTGIASHDVVGMPVNLAELVLYQKRIQGALFGMGSPSREIGRFVDLYRAGRIRLDELVTRTYPLAAIGQAVEDLKAGVNLRGVIDFTLT